MNRPSTSSRRNCSTATPLPEGPRGRQPPTTREGPRIPDGARAILIGSELPQAPRDKAPGPRARRPCLNPAPQAQRIKKPAAGTGAPAAGFDSHSSGVRPAFSPKRDGNQATLAARILLRRRFFHIVQPDIATPRPAKTIVEGSGTTTRLPDWAWNTSHWL